MVPLGESRQIEAGFNQLERRGVVHRSMRYEILLGKRRDHNERDPEASQCKVARLICRRHDWRYAIRARDGDWRNVIVQTSAFIERFDQNGIFPRWAVHKSIDQLGRKLRAQLDIALWVLIHTATAGPVHLDSGFYVGNLGKVSTLRVRKVLAQRNHICMVSIEVGEIREIGMPVCRIDFPGDMVGVHHFKNRFRGYLLGRWHNKTLRGSCHPVKPIGMRACGSWRKPAVGSGEIRRHEVVKRQIAVVVETHSAFASKVSEVRRTAYKFIVRKLPLNEGISVHGENAGAGVR